MSLDLDDGKLATEEQKELLQEIISNSKLSEGYLTLARDLDVMEPKTPEDIYKVSSRRTPLQDEMFPPEILLARALSYEITN